jgi:anaerobic C4-dicarboxylate transporter DcuA
VPFEVLLIVLAVVTAAAAMESAGGTAWLVGIAERIIRRHPRQVTVVAPLVTYGFTFAAGTGHIVYPLLPVIYEVAREHGIRPERPMAIATIASQQAITASPVSAATAVMIGLLAVHGVGLGTILLIGVPATLAGVVVGALVQMRVGRELADDPDYQRRLAAGEADPPRTPHADAAPLPATARRSAVVFFAAVALVVASGLVPALRTVVDGDGAPVVIPMPAAIALVMLAAGALIIALCRVPVKRITRSETCQSGFTAVIGILGLAWLGDTFITANQGIVIGGLTSLAQAAPWSFAFGLFLASMLLYSQAATARALMPLGLSLGIPAPTLVGMLPAVNGYFVIPNYGTLIAAMQFDRSGTTRIGRWILNHSFMLPGLVSTGVAVATGLALAALFR